MTLTLAPAVSPPPPPPPPAVDPGTVQILDNCTIFPRPDTGLADSVPMASGTPHNKVFPFPYVFEPPYSSGKQSGFVPTNPDCWFQLPLCGPIDSYLESAGGGRYGVPYLDSAGRPGAWQHQDPITGTAEDAAKLPIFPFDRAGGRCDYAPTAFVTRCVTPMDSDAASCWTGVDVFGRVDGIDDGTGERTLFVDAGQFSHPTDICVVPGPTVGPHYIADGGNNRIALVDLSKTPPTVSTYASGLHNPTSVAAAPDGTLYVADHDADRIIAISPSGTQSVIPLSSPIFFPFCLRLTSTGKLVVMNDWQGASGIWLVDPVTGSVTTLVRQSGGMPTTAPPPAQRTRMWGWLDVDANGTIGNKDDILFTYGTFSTTANGLVLANGSPPNYQGYNAGYNNQILRLSINATSLTQTVPVFNDHGLHYMWGVWIHPTEAKFMASGWGTCMTHALYRPRHTTDPTYGSTGGPNSGGFWWDDIYGVTAQGKAMCAGRNILWAGTVPGGPTRPSLTSLLGGSGLSFVGTKTADELASMSLADFTTFIQSGAGGSVPRPEIVSPHIDHLYYFMQRRSVIGYQQEIPTPA